MKKTKANLKFLEEITDDFGIWQHTSNFLPIKKEGYALDDIARGMVVYLLYGKKDKALTMLSYLEKSLKNGLFIGFFDEYRKELVYPSSEDALGLAYLALSHALTLNFEPVRVEKLLSQINVSTLKESSAIRTQCYHLIALSYQKNRQEADNILKKITGSFDNEWNWFEQRMTYANAIIPFSLLTYLTEFNIKDENLEIRIKESIKTLEKYMRIGVIPSPVGNRIWQKKGRIGRDIYGQQPIDAAFMVVLLTHSYKYFQNEEYKKKADEWMEWFYGNNIYKESLISENGSCADGIDEDKINRNSGAESNIMYLWALYEFNKISD